jgi:uncharacterized damage-inducible protein DinB
VLTAILQKMEQEKLEKLVQQVLYLTPSQSHKVAHLYKVNLIVIHVLSSSCLERLLVIHVLQFFETWRKVGDI